MPKFTTYDAFPKGDNQSWAKYALLRPLRQPAELTHVHYPFKDAPAFGNWQEIAPGLLWLRLPLPFSLDHINCWAIKDGDGFAIIDTGIDDETTRGIWLDFHQQLKITRVIGTHFHLDHIGLVGWMNREFNVPVAMTTQECAYAKSLNQVALDDYMALQLGHYAHCGYSQDQLDGVQSRGNGFATKVSPLPDRVEIIKHGDQLSLDGDDIWDVIIGRGHAPEMACLYNQKRNILISADQVLPRISPIIGIWPKDPESNPLDDFMTSNETFFDLPQDCLVLPSHGLPFVGLHKRVQWLKDHHHDRLNDIRVKLVAPMNALEIAQAIFNRPLDNQLVSYAVGETLSHLNYLRDLGEITRITKNGHWIYAKS